MIALGGYPEAGIQQPGKDNLSLPAATQYWRQRTQPPDLRSQLTGSEIHAYLYQYFLCRRAITPIPNLWLVLLVCVFAKGTVTLIHKRSPLRQKVVYLEVSGTFVYTAVSLQAYVTFGVSIPILLPVLLYWFFIIPTVVFPKL
jgi:hypothetical protein